MLRKFAPIAVVGALVMATAPAFAQDLNLNPLGLPLIPNNLNQLPIIGGGGLDLDPLHIFTPAAAPAAPAAAPAAVVHVHHHHVHHLIHHHVHHVVVHHKAKK